ncbi:Glycosyl hydrolase family 26 [Modestobacter sp. DSM 44400]|uniref:glycoside hydrolase family 26 protein n=1 Tax=Modestobacter sp. DSM 44400 TaxID=1550230 RepID=UPI00089D6168|nr:glycosyl hydrolase [Modestobacter sp. DSM 44400]SDY13890.1 Glycosyl hydrolase family 26 [Modestobacter sp. DSM 44400]
MRTGLAGLAAVAATTLVSLSACATGGAGGTAASPRCVPVPSADLAPADGVLIGANIDWGQETLAEYAERLGQQPAVAVAFTGFPLTGDDGQNLDAAVGQVATGGGLLLLTLEPTQGLVAVTEGVATALARRLDGYNRQGVPVVVRFAHEMNGSWYAWGQQPTAYVTAFRRVAAALHSGAPGSATMWAPNYGGGYPFTGGEFLAGTRSQAAAVLDTDGDGVVTGADDPYAPYWPGDDAVDWVGMSLYHWGDTYPWGENEVPEPGKFVAQLTGEYLGLGGDDRSVPDFYGTYAEKHGKPLAIPETAALYAPGEGGADELSVKRGWWHQVFDPRLHELLPRLAMINWFEWDKEETETGGRIDWTAVSSPSVRGAYRADLPGWARWAPDVPACGTPAGTG